MVQRFQAGYRGNMTGYDPDPFFIHSSMRRLSVDDGRFIVVPPVPLMATFA
jgi:hypothetical protein